MRRYVMVLETTETPQQPEVRIGHLRTLAEAVGLRLVDVQEIRPEKPLVAADRANGAIR